MRRYAQKIVCVRVGIIMLAIVQLMNCSCEWKRGPGYSAGNGKVTYSELDKSDAGQMTIKSDQGETVISTQKVNESDFDVPFYPGADQSPSQSLSLSNRSRPDSDRWAMVVLRTKDPFEKVAAFYKDKMADADALDSTTGEDKITTLVKSKGDLDPLTTVRISRKKTDSETLINITRASGR